MTDLQILEDKYCSVNYEKLPVTITKGKGVYLYDERGNEYLDFLSGYSVINQGHSHPRLIKAAIEQLNKLTLCSRSFTNDKLAEFSEFICKTLFLAFQAYWNAPAQLLQIHLRGCIGAPRKTSASLA